MVPTDAIRFIKPIDDEERERIAERYDIDGDNYHISIQFSDKSTKLATETLDDIRAQGIALVTFRYCWNSQRRRQCNIIILQAEPRSAQKILSFGSS